MQKRILAVILMTLVTIMLGTSVFAQDDVQGGIVSNNPPIYIVNANRPEARYIPWVFFTYTEPNFLHRPAGQFSPQHVTQLCNNNYGWIRIHTSEGEKWTYISGRSETLARTKNLYSYMGARTPVNAVGAQLVTVLQQDGNWIQINTWLGPKWVNLAAPPSTAHFDAMLRRFGNNIAVYFENIETGFVYTYNANRTFFGASVSKAVFALYIYEKAERGEVDLNSSITFTSADFVGGSGVIRQRYSVGRTFTQREILGLNLYESDNIATLMLRRVHGIAGYRQFVAGLGGNTAFIGDRIMNGNLNANEAGRFARAIFNYIESDGRYSAEFRGHLLNNQFPFIVSDYPVASKTGWTAPSAWHDMAIVYAPSPYILVILSARDGWRDQDYRDFEEISMAFQAFNNEWFVN